MSSTYRILFFFLVITFYACSNNNGETKPQSNISFAKGTLFIIGGGEISDSLRMEMLNAAGWQPGDLISAVTLASGWGDSAYIWMNDAFKKLTGKNCVKIDSAAVHNKLSLDSLRKSKIIYLGGGDQSAFMRKIENTEVKKIIRDAYYNGALVGGTSAGAVLMSDKMITGNGLIDTVYESTFSILKKGNIELEEGLSLLDSVIIDMHFIARSRYNRLLSAQIENPDYQCIGIDEATAIIVKNDSATVAGQNQVIVFSTPSKIKSGPNNLMGMDDMKISIYLPGEKFKIKNISPH